MIKGMIIHRLGWMTYKKKNNNFNEWKEEGVSGIDIFLWKNVNGFNLPC